MSTKSEQPAANWTALPERPARLREARQILAIQWEVMRMVGSPAPPVPRSWWERLSRRFFDLNA